MEVGNKTLPVSDIWKRFLLLLPASVQSRKRLYLSHRGKSWGKVTRAHNNTKSEKVVPSHIKMTEEHCSRKALKMNYTTALKTNCATEATKIQSSIKSYVSFQKMPRTLHFMLYLNQMPRNWNSDLRWIRNRSSAPLSRNKDGFRWNLNKIKRDRGKPRCWPLLSLHLKTSRVSFSAHGYYTVCRLTAC